MTFIGEKGSYCAFCRFLDEGASWCETFDTVVSQTDFCSFGKDRNIEIAKEKKDEK